MEKKLKEVQVIPQANGGEVRLSVPTDDKGAEIGVWVELRGIQISPATLTEVFKHLHEHHSAVMLSIAEDCTVTGDLNETYVMRDNVPTALKNLILVTDQKDVVLWGRTMGDFKELRELIKKKIVPIAADVDIYPSSELADASAQFWTIIEEEAAK